MDNTCTPQRLDSCINAYLWHFSLIFEMRFDFTIWHLLPYLLLLRSIDQSINQVQCEERVMRKSCADLCGLYRVLYPEVRHLFIFWNLWRYVF